jgi:hypothetical protein
VRRCVLRPAVSTLNKLSSVRHTFSLRLGIGLGLVAFLILDQDLTSYVALGEDSVQGLSPANIGLK